MDIFLTSSTLSPLRELVHAADSLIFMGFMKPCTVFVSAPTIHLQALRTAWARRVLKPADGYLITSLGEFLASLSYNASFFAYFKSWSYETLVIPPCPLHFLNSSHRLWHRLWCRCRSEFSSLSAQNFTVILILAESAAARVGSALMLSFGSAMLC